MHAHFIGNERYTRNVRTIIRAHVRMYEYV